MGWLFISLMDNEERVKNKSDKLARQSMALLQRLKSKKEKPSVPANQQNYIDDLYLKVFGKCSPHFDKMATSDELYAQQRRNITRIDQLKQDMQESLKEKEELKAQLGKLKHSSDDSTKMKALNIELNRLQAIKEQNAALIKNLRKENQSLAHELQQLQQEYHKTTEMNKELQLFVESVANDIQSQKRNQAEEQARNEIEAQLKAELMKANEELQASRNKQLEVEERLAVIAHQNTMLKLNLKQAEKGAQDRLQKEQRKWQQQRVRLQGSMAKRQQRHEAEIILANDQSAKYQSRLTIAEQALKEKEQQLKSIHSQYESLRVTCDRLKTQISEATQAKQQLEIHLANQRKKLQDRQEELALSQEENAELCQSLKRHTEQAQKLQAMLESYTQTNQKLITRNQQLQQDLVDLGNKLSTSEEQLTAKLEQLKERLKFFKENNQTLNNQKVDYIANIELLADEVKKLSEQVFSKDQEIQKMCEEYRQAVAALNKQKSGREQQLQAKLNEAIKNFQESLQKRQSQYSCLKQQHQKHRDSYSKLEQQSDRQFSSLKQQLTRTQGALSTLEGHHEQLQHKIKGQFDRIQRLQLEKNNLQTSLQQQAEQFNQEITALRPQLQQYKERLEVIREERDQLNQEKITLIQDNQKMSEANNKLRTEVSEKKLKIHKSEQKICQLNDIINALPKKSTKLDEQKQQNGQIRQTQDPIEEKVQSKCNKHIATINELSSELTQAYKMIQQLQHTVSQLKVKTEGKSEKPQRDSVQKKERGRSIKKIAGIFGF